MINDYPYLKYSKLIGVKRLFGKIGDAGRQMAANDPLVSAIKSGEWTQADLISFQEQYGLEPTGFMDMETASLLRGLE